ncbi:MAG: endonuclease V [Thermoplasmatales archaeon]
MIEVPDIYSSFYDLLAQIPKGYVSTYGDMAIQLGDIAASRAVGEMLSENESPDKYPCYRVVMSDGTLGGYTSPKGVEEKVRRLKRDGIRISKGKLENLEMVRFSDFKSSFPLRKFREESFKINIDKSVDHSSNLRAMDISYFGRIGVGVAVDFQKDIRFEIKVKKVKAPYIPNYLYLREGEIYESLVSSEATNVIDGNGVIHRDGRGVATLVGASKNVATVGLAKSLLLGEEKGKGIFLGTKRIGEKLGKYYISKGFGIGLNDCVKALALESHFPQTRYPDKLSRRYRDEILAAQYSI